MTLMPYFRRTLYVRDVGMLDLLSSRIALGTCLTLSSFADLAVHLRLQSGQGV